MNWTFFLNMTHRIEPFFNMIERILNFSKIMTHWIERIEPFSNTTHRIELFSNTTQRIEPSFFLKYDSKNRTHFFNVTLFAKKIIKKLNSFPKMARRIELFSCMTQRIEPSLNATQRVEFFWAWLEERNLFFFLKKWLKELNFWVFVKKRLKELDFSQKYDTKNWTSFQYDSKIFFNMTRRIEPFFITWFKDFFFSQNKTQRIWLFLKTHRLEPFKKYIFFKKILRELFFLNLIHRIEPLFFEYNSQNWTLFSSWLIEIEPFFQHDS